MSEVPLHRDTRSEGLVFGSAGLVHALFFVAPDLIHIGTASHSCEVVVLKLRTVPIASRTCTRAGHAPSNTNQKREIQRQILG